MFDVNADPAVVTAKIERDLAAARQGGECTRADAAAEAPRTDVAEIAVAPVAVPSPADAQTAYRHGRLAVVATLVLALVLVWIVQKRRNGG